MNNTVVLRPAVPIDIDALARLWVATFPDKFGPTLGDKAERIICDWLRLSERHLETTTVAEINGIVTGYIILDTPSAPTPDSGRWLWHAIQLHNGIFGALRSFVLMVLINDNHKPRSDEVYIEMLGVAPAWRGEGLAAKLLSHAETVAGEEGAAKLTLTVVSGNKAAITLYKKHGFETTHKKQSRILKWITGYSSYYQMVKQLEKSEK
jgi:ribosomal protein S18 acetylase RimI-like enzyme